MDETPNSDQPSTDDPSASVERTVGAEIRTQVAERLGGPRGSVETALPIVVFTVVFVVADEVLPALVVGGVAALVALAVRLVQGSSTRFARNGLVGIAVAAVFAMAMGRAEAAFLPNIIQNAVWALVLGASIVVRWPLAGFAIGAVLGDTVGWRDSPAIVRLSNRLTLVLLVPMVIRVAV